MYTDEEYLDMLPQFERELSQIREDTFRKNHSNNPRVIDVSVGRKVPCEMCDTYFIPTRYSKYFLCSPECRREKDREYQRVYYYTHRKRLSTT